MEPMATKKMVRGSLPRPDRSSKKRSGLLKTGIRLSVDDNKLLKKAAELEGFSVNLWMVRTLVAAAKKRIETEMKLKLQPAKEPRT
jgi:uncharacterized protein (DUF1778 family)